MFYVIWDNIFFFFFFSKRCFYYNIVHICYIWLTFPFYYNLFLFFMFLYLSFINYFHHITFYKHGPFSVFLRDFPFNSFLLTFRISGGTFCVFNYLLFLLLVMIYLFYVIKIKQVFFPKLICCVYLVTLFCMKCPIKRRALFLKKRYAWKTLCSSKKLLVIHVETGLGMTRTNHPCCHPCKSRKSRLRRAMKSLPKGKAAWAAIARAKF